MAGVRGRSHALLSTTTRPAHHDDEPRPRLEAQGDYAFGVLAPAPNFKHIPELAMRQGYAYVWGLILATTALQLWYFRRKHWI